MTVEELREENVDTLNDMVIDCSKEYFDLRMQHGSAKLKNFTQLGKKKREIARIKTIIKEKSHE